MSQREPNLDELRRVVGICADSNTVLVGGMAVVITAASVGVGATTDCVTRDADFFGNSMAAQLAADRLELAGYQPKLFLASLDDPHTPNSAKISVVISPEVFPVEIDFLARINDLSSDEIGLTAVNIRIDGKDLRVEHPMLIMENKIGNLSAWTNKRTTAGVEQARVSVAVLNAHLSKVGDDPQSQRKLLSAIERVGRLSQRDGACFVYHTFGIDVLDAVPAKRVQSPEFHNIRWPQIQSETQAIREKFARLHKIKPDTNPRRFKL